MHVIGFSHQYLKLSDQTKGILLAVHKVNEDPNLVIPQDGLAYDTSYLEDGILKVGTLDPSERLLLVFIGDKRIPFTTYRKIPQDYTPFDKAKYEASGCLPYSDLVGEKFFFKFKGEPYPDWVVDESAKKDAPWIRIF